MARHPSPLTGFFRLESLPKLLEAYPCLLTHISPTFPWCGYPITSSVPHSGAISWGVLTYHDNHENLCGYPFYSAGYALQSAGFSRHKHTNEPLRDQKRILMARRTRPKLGQNFAAQRLLNLWSPTGCRSNCSHTCVVHFSVSCTH